MAEIPCNVCVTQDVCRERADCVQAEAWVELAGQPIMEIMNREFNCSKCGYPINEAGICIDCANKRGEGGAGAE